MSSLSSFKLNLSKKVSKIASGELKTRFNHSNTLHGTILQEFYMAKYQKSYKQANWKYSINLLLPHSPYVFSALEFDA